MTNIFDTFANLFHTDPIKTLEHCVENADKYDERDWRVLLALVTKKRNISQELVASLTNLSTFKTRTAQLTRINKKLIRFLRRSKTHTLKESSVYEYILTKELAKNFNLSKLPNEKEEVAVLKKTIAGIILQIRSLYTLILKQQIVLNTLAKKQKISSQDRELIIILEIENSEKNIEQNILSLLTLAHKRAKEVETQLKSKKAQEPAELRITDVSFREILDQHMGFTGFYDLYKKTFPADERESSKVLQEYLNVRYTNNAVDMTTYCIGAFVKEQFAGGIYFIFIQHNKLCYGMTWWTLVPLEFRGKLQGHLGSSSNSIAEMLVKQSEEKLKQCAQSRGLQLSGVFAEINDPSKMTQEQIKDEVMNPHFRINFWNKVGYKPCFKDYVQLLKYDHDKPVEEQVVATYCNLFVKPTSLRWKLYLPKEDLREVIFSLGTISCTWSKEKLEGFSYYKEMIAKIDAQKKHYITDMDKEELKAQVQKVRPNDYYTFAS